MAISRATPLPAHPVPLDLRARARRIAVRTAIVLASIYATYLLVGNLLVATPLLRHLINRNPTEVLLEYSSASTFWFGRVHVRNLVVRGRDSAADFMVRVDDATLSIDLFALTAKQLKVTRARGTGASVRVRERLDPENIQPAALEGTPPIEGLEDVPLKPPPPPRQPVTDESYPYWTIDLADVDMPAREVWVGPYRFAGSMRVVGSFYLRPSRKLAVGPATIEVTGGELWFAKRIFASEVKGRIEARVDMHDPRRWYQAEFLRWVHGHVKLDSTIVDLGFVQRWLGTQSKMLVHGGAGTVSSDVSMAAGVLLRGSKLSVHARDAELAHPELSVATSMHAELSIGDDATLAASFEDVALRRRWAENLPLKIARLDVLARTRELDLVSRPFSDLLLSFDLPSAELADVRALNTLLPKDVRLGAGRATAKAHVDVSMREALAKGSARIEVGKSSVTIEDVAIGGAATIGVSVPKMTFSPFAIDLADSFVELRDVAVAAPGGKEGKAPRQWWGRVELVAPVVEKDFRTGLRFKMRDARPVMHVFAAKEGLPGWSEELLSLDGLSGTARLKLGERLVSLDAFDAKGGSFTLTGRYEKRGQHEEGRLTLGNGAIAVGVELVDGSTSVKPKVAPNWSKEREKAVAPH